MQSRRAMLASSLGIAAVSLSGCSAIEELTGGPDPRVTDTRSDRSIGDVLSGSVQIQVLVVNDGDTGDVEVTVTTYDGNGNVLDDYRQVVEIEEGQSRRVDFNVSPSRGSEDLAGMLGRASGMAGALQGQADRLAEAAAVLNGEHNGTFSEETYHDRIQGTRTELRNGEFDIPAPEEIESEF